MHILKSSKIFCVLYMKEELHISSMKVVEFPYFIYENRRLNKVLSTPIMFRWNRVLSSVRTFRPDRVLCALGHGDPRRDPAWPLSWKTLCLHLNVRAQMSGLWGWGGLLWVTVLFSEWGSMALRGVSAAVGLSLSPARFISLGLLETPQVGYLVIIPIFQHILVE